jgi:leucyl/phenylalanyl-tRNA--protein transferase
MVLFPDELHVSKSLARRLRQHRFEIKMDTAFLEVMAGCAEPRRDQDGTWISPEMTAAYAALHQAGYAHSVETWVDGTLAGGLYGVGIGRAFFGESMFARAADASKLALAHLVTQLRRWSFGLIDCQMRTAHLATMGAREIPRTAFVSELAALVRAPSPASPWRFDADLASDIFRGK